MQPHTDNEPEACQKTANEPEACQKTADLYDVLVCPLCHGCLGWAADLITCQRCRKQFVISDNIPILLADQNASEHDELDHHRSHLKSQQAEYFDREEDVDFETIRPHGTPGLYRWMLEEKFRRAVTGVGSTLQTGNATALVVCGGSGMDAEFLSATGCCVITSDISIGAARRARERARRFGLRVLAIVADVEHLPFRDHCMDLVYVHDGLHHLSEPNLGLMEMARVAGGAVSVNEPARAFLTAIAIRLRLALEREDAGNTVARMTIREIETLLTTQGFRVVCAQRYAMYYRHQPGRLSHILSTPGLLSVAKTGLRVLNGAVGSIGNKLTVQAVRG